MSETSAPSSRWYAAEKGVMILNVSETLQSSWSHSSVFDLENSLKINLSDFFYPHKKLVAGLSETGAPTSK